MAPGRLCPGLPGKKCGAFMSGVERDPHSVCARCRGQDCHRLLTCRECVSWSAQQWEEFSRKKKKPKKAKSVNLPPPLTAGMLPFGMNIWSWSSYYKYTYREY